MSAIVVLPLGLGIVKDLAGQSGARVELRAGLPDIDRDSGLTVWVFFEEPGPA